MNKKQIVILDGAEMLSEERTMDVLAQQFKFPDYFGRNWDAVWDCFKDFGWFDKVNIIVILKNNEKISDSNLKNKLINFLKDTQDYWKEHDGNFQVKIE